MAPAKTKPSKNKTAKNSKGKPVKKGTDKTKPAKNKTKKVTPKKNKDKCTIVLVYANWCTHCQNMKPQWDEMKNRLGMDIETIEIEDSDFDKDMKIRDIDNKLNGEHIDVVGYPTMFKVHNGHADYYGGSRTASDMITWAKSHNGGYVKSKIRATNRSIRSKSQ
jgi:thiol-disulfide isomerase/thioredoxin